MRLLYLLLAGINAHSLWRILKSEARLDSELKRMRAENPNIVFPPMWTRFERAANWGVKIFISCFIAFCIFVVIKGI